MGKKGAFTQVDAHRQHLHELGHTDDDIARRMGMIAEFQTVVAGPDGGIPSTAGRKEVEGFARLLVEQGRNTVAAFSALRDYADWLGHRSLTVASSELMDCHNALDVLASVIDKDHGRRVRDRVFPEPPPPLGADEESRSRFTRAATGRMERTLSREGARAAWFQVQHGIPAEAWKRSDAADRATYLRCADIDEFLAVKRAERDELLTRLRDEQKPWYTTEIDDEVLEFVKSDPEMEVGRREGNEVFITKTPYNAVAYLHEKDPTKKRFFACHCPLLREAILAGQPISADACTCSLGHASHYLAGLGEQLEGEVLESVLQGDDRCRFVFRLPSAIVAAPAAKTANSTDPTRRGP